MRALTVLVSSVRHRVVYLLWYVESVPPVIRPVITRTGEPATAMCFAVLTALQRSGSRLLTSFSTIEILVPYSTLGGAFFV